MCPGRPNPSVGRIAAVAGIALLPIVVQIGAWGSRWIPDAKKLDGAARKHLREIQEGGPRVWAKRMDELRAEHLR